MFIFTETKREKVFLEILSCESSLKCVQLIIDINKVSVARYKLCMILNYKYI